MTEKMKNRILQSKISSWYILILCIITTSLTSHFLSMYGLVHWPILTSSFKLKVLEENVFADDECKNLIRKNKNLKQFFKDLPEISERINNGGWKLMGKTNIYCITGLISFILAIFTFFCSPRWVGIIALPFGLYSFNISTIIM